MIPQMVDTHCHLSFDPLESDIENVLKRSKDKGVTRIIHPSYDTASWSKVSAMQHEGVFPAFGLHPWVAEEKLDVETLENLLVKHKAVALGEIGLDYHLKIFDKDRQIEVFRLQLDIAKKLDLPVLLHCRGAFDDMFDILKEYSPDLKGVIHAFSKSPELAKRFLDLGYMIAFGGAVTRKNAHKARKSAAYVPIESILLETDAPSIGINNVDAKNVEPGHVAEIAEYLAEIRFIDITEVAAGTTKNAERLFNIG